MVLKNFINYLINKYLKDYIERLDYEKIKLSLKQGQLRHLEILLTMDIVVDRSHLLGESPFQTGSTGESNR